MPASNKFTPGQRAEIMAAWEDAAGGFKARAARRKALMEKWGFHSSLPGYWRARGTPGVGVKKKAGALAAARGVRPPGKKKLDRQLTVINSALEKIHGLPPVAGHTGAVVQEFLRRLRASGVELQSLTMAGGQCTINYTITETFES